MQIELRDVTAAAAAHATLERFAFYDPLTGSLNRRAWNDQVQSRLVDTDPTVNTLSIAMIDLDHFKTYNDAHGHDAGDAFLREFTRAARAVLRHQDIFARWGGEEFMLALPDTTPDQATLILDRIRAAVPAGQTCSIGHTTWKPGEPLTDAIARADRALYRAKDLGRDRRVED